jgi:hypothetical protein
MSAEKRGHNCWLSYARFTKLDPLARRCANGKCNGSRSRTSHLPLARGRPLPGGLALPTTFDGTTTTARPPSRKEKPRLSLKKKIHYYSSDKKKKEIKLF